MRDQRSGRATYLVTLWTYEGRALFADAGVAALFCRVLRGLRRQLGFRLHAYVVLPDRVRLIVATGDTDTRSIRLIVQRIKSRFAREANARTGRRGLVWRGSDQREGLGSIEDIVKRVDYLHRHPMVARLVRAPGDWRWSSYRAWSGDGATPVPVDLPESGGTPSIG